MAVAKLQDSQPLTYEWLNSLVSAINAITPSGSSNAAVPDRITVNGVNSKDVVIDVGYKSLAAKVGEDNTSGTITFSKEFSSAPHVVAMINNHSAEASSPDLAIIAIGKVSKKGFDCKVKLVADKAEFTKTNKSVSISYIAIGS